MFTNIEWAGAALNILQNGPVLLKIIRMFSRKKEIFALKWNNAGSCNSMEYTLDRYTMMILLYGITYPYNDLY